MMPAFHAPPNTGQSSPLSVVLARERKTLQGVVADQCIRCARLANTMPMAVDAGSRDGLEEYVDEATPDVAMNDN